MSMNPRRRETDLKEIDDEAGSKKSRPSGTTTAAAAIAMPALTLSLSCSDANNWVFPKWKMENEKERERERERGREMNDSIRLGWINKQMWLIKIVFNEI